MMAYILSLVTMVVIFFVNRSERASAHKTMPDNPLTSHVLDTGKGGPATGIQVHLYRLQSSGNQWERITSAVTNQDGRISHLLSDAEFTAGVYKFHFDTKAYYENLGTKTFYPYIEIVFEIEKPKEHYHVPILLSPFGFTTYRGS